MGRTEGAYKMEIRTFKELHQVLALFYLLT